MSKGAFDANVVVTCKKSRELDEEPEGRERIGGEAFGVEITKIIDAVGLVVGDKDDRQRQVAGIAVAATRKALRMLGYVSMDKPEGSAVRAALRDHPNWRGARMICLAGCGGGDCAVPAEELELTELDHAQAALVAFMLGQHKIVLPSPDGNVI